MECYTSFSQNLRARNGYAVFATTPDRPWVKELKNAAISGEPEFKAWHVTYDVPASVNPETYSAEAEQRDRHLMTKEKFEIHYHGKLGDYVGAVYSYQRGQRLFDAESHPWLFRDGELDLPTHWTIACGADTGTFASFLIVAFDDEGVAYVLDEFPNYDYKAGVIELDENITIPEWVHQIHAGCARRGARPLAWADRNSQFRRELGKYDLNLQPNLTPNETRTEIAREYFTRNRIFLRRGLRILPFELENASWPDESSAAGKFERVKDRDHTLDCLEHVLSRRPRADASARGRDIDRRTAGEMLFGREIGYRHRNPHTGVS
jgi:hypothetical protein